MIPMLDKMTLLCHLSSSTPLCCQEDKIYSRIRVCVCVCGGVSSITCLCIEVPYIISDSHSVTSYRMPPLLLWRFSSIFIGC